MKFFVVSKRDTRRNMCESTYSSLKNRTGVVVLFSCEKSQFLLIMPSAHDYSNMAWHYREPRVYHIAIKVRSQWKILPQHSSREWNLHINENFKIQPSSAHASEKRHILSNLRKRESENFTICFYLLWRKTISRFPLSLLFYDNALLTVKDIMNRFKCRCKKPR